MFSDKVYERRSVRGRNVHETKCQISILGLVDVRGIQTSLAVGGGYVPEK